MGQHNWILLIFLISIVLNGIADGFRIKDIKKPTSLVGELYHWFWGGTLLALLLLMLFKVPSFSLFRYLIAYSLLRFGIFDFVVNIISGKHYLHIGETSKFDKIMRKIFKTPSSKVVMGLFKSISLITGMFLIQYFE